jgi:di/tricarboxylate transporter
VPTTHIFAYEDVKYNEAEMVVLYGCDEVVQKVSETNPAKFEMVPIFEAKKIIVLQTLTESPQNALYSQSNVYFLASTNLASNFNQMAKFCLK